MHQSQVCFFACSLKVVRIVSDYLLRQHAQFAARAVPLWISVFLLLPMNASCGRNPKTIPDGRLVDHLGESLKAFRSVHRKAYCYRVPGEWAEDDTMKMRFQSIHCGLSAGVTFGGHELLSESNPRYPFGAYATFYRKRLVEITYTLSDANIESVASLIARECGPPLELTKDESGALTRAFWVTKRSSVVVQSIPVNAMASGNGMLKVTNTVLLFATSVTITANEEHNLTRILSPSVLE
jgi:hypothetical protein